MSFQKRIQAIATANNTKATGRRTLDKLKAARATSVMKKCLPTAVKMCGQEGII
jgi:hypothetical protein